ncbi:MAG: D-alanine--D-alanine ligase [Alphaproteobacteria bacterium]|nr:D-alanine--D-alanine ligase [Alphaproteobacteria bacterium]
MRVCVLCPTAEGGPTPYVPVCDPDIGRFAPEHTFELHFVHKETAEADIAALAARGFDVFFNMCDGAPEQGIAGLEAVQALERLGLPFTGAGSAFYSVTRERMKQVCATLGVPTPAHGFARDLDEVEEIGARLRSPLFVKHHDSYASVGLRRSSRVEGPEALRAEARRLLARFGRVLIEEFIEGEELSAMVVERPWAEAPLAVLRPLRIEMPPGESFVHYALKDVGRRSLRWRPVEDAALQDRIAPLARALFRGVEGRGYGRCDLRLSREGELYALEMNANCALFCVPGTPDHPSIGDAILMNDPIGPGGFLREALRVALHHHEAAGGLSAAPAPGS